MTKKQLIKWVEGKQKDALLAVSEQYIKALEDHTAALHVELGLAALASEIKPLLEQADNLLMAWREKWENRVNMVSYYQNLHGRLYDFIKGENALYNALADNEFRDTTEERRRIDDAKRSVEREVNSNYSNVLRNLQAFKDAKLGLEYLKELGFDVSEVIAMDQAPVSTALAVPVDTRFLFLGKEETKCG